MKSVSCYRLPRQGETPKANMPTEKPQPALLLGGDGRKTLYFKNQRYLKILSSTVVAPLTKNACAKKAPPTGSRSPAHHARPVGWLQRVNHRPNSYQQTFQQHRKTWWLLRRP